MSETYTSMPAMVKTRFRLAKSPDSPPLFSADPAGSSVAITEEILAHTRLPEALIHFLVELDRKVDAILSQMQKDTLDGDFPHEGRVVELSGSNLVLECREPLAPGDTLEVILFLEEFPLRLASGMASVDAILKADPQSGPDKSVYALSFVNIGEDERDNVIRFVFREERKMIRRKKHL